MRSTNTTINPQLSRLISETGHTDLIVVTDAGLPIPTGSERVDLAYRPGAPAFFDVLDTVLAELVIEGATVSAEIEEHSPHVLAALRERFDALGVAIELFRTWSSRSARTPLAPLCAQASSRHTPTSFCTLALHTEMLYPTRRTIPTK